MGCLQQGSGLDGAATEVLRAAQGQHVPDERVRLLADEVAREEIMVRSPAARRRLTLVTCVACVGLATWIGSAQAPPSPEASARQVPPSPQTSAAASAGQRLDDNALRNAWRSGQ